MLRKKSPKREGRNHSTWFLGGKVEGVGVNSRGFGRKRDPSLRSLPLGLDHCSLFRPRFQELLSKR